MGRDGKRWEELGFVDVRAAFFIINYQLFIVHLINEVTVLQVVIFFVLSIVLAE
jgi:hypothetical protein